MYFQTHFGAPEAEQIVVRPKYRNTDWTLLGKPELIKPPGIQDIKWIELWKKWRPLIPIKDRGTFKFYHEEPTKEVIAAVKAHSKDAKKKRQDRSRSNVSTNKKRAPPKPKETLASSGNKAII